MAEKRVAFKAWQSDYRNNQKKIEYHRVRAEVQMRVRRLKNGWWVKKSEELQTLADSHNSKEFFAATRKLYGPSSKGARPISGKDGTVYKDKDKIKERWSEHFSELLNQDTDVIANITDELPKAATQFHLGNLPTREELIKAIKMMKSGKAAGPDGIPVEVYKNGGKCLHEALLKLFQRMWASENIPADLKNAKIVTIFKKGNKFECGNFRGISLLSIAGKILSRIICYRLGDLTEACLPESQCGFRPGRGTVDMIFAARQIQEKCREQHRDLYMAFIDLTKAFDTVHRPTLWKVLTKIGCPDKLVNMIRLFHEGMRASVLVDGEFTEDFEVKTGVKQGCVMAPTLFSIFLTAVLHLVRQNMPAGIELRYRFNDIFNIRRLKAKTKTTKVTVCELQYADDNAILAHSEEDLQAAMNAFTNAYSALGLKINAKKTQILYQPRPELSTHDLPEVSIHAAGEELRVVDTFNYLGSTLSSKVNIDAEIDRRLQAAGMSVGKLQARVFNNKAIHKNTKLMVYKAVVLPTLLYGSETWVTYSHNLKALEKFHDRTVRRILGIKWQDRVTTNTVFERADTTSIEAMVIKNQLRWSGHIVRMPDARLPKQILYSELTNGRRTHGGQRKRYKDTLHRGLKQFLIRVETWENLATHRKTWRSSLHRGVKIFEENRRSKREQKRTARKTNQSSSATPEQSYPCPLCDKVCRARIGLISRLRVH